MKQTFKQKITSRKFWLPVVTGFLFLFDSSLDPEQVAGIAAIVAAFVAGESYVDVQAMKGNIGNYVAFLEQSLQTALVAAGGEPEQQQPVEGVVEG